MKKEYVTLIIGVIAGVVIGSVLGNILINSSLQKEKKQDIFYIDMKTDLQDFKEMNITSTDCYDKFIDERARFLENPYNPQDFECSIINATFWRFKDIRGYDYDIVGHTTYCKCWKK